MPTPSSPGAAGAAGSYWSPEYRIQTRHQSETTSSTWRLPTGWSGKGGSLDMMLGRFSFVFPPQPDGATEFIPMLDQLTPEYARYGAAL